MPFYQDSPQVDVSAFLMPFAWVVLCVRLGLFVASLLVDRNSRAIIMALTIFYAGVLVALFGYLINLLRLEGFATVVERLARSDPGTVLIFAAVCTAVRVDLNYAPKISKANEFESFGCVSRWIQEISDSLVYAGILVFLLIRPYFIQTFRIPSESMLNTLQVGDVLVVDKFTYRFREEPKNGDVVVFKPPKNALMPGQPKDTDFVKRLVGSPGDVVEIIESQLYRNGVQIYEPYLKEQDIGSFKLVKYKGKLTPLLKSRQGYTNPGSPYEILPQDEKTVWALPAEPIPPGYYLMVGDNRNQSFDGRFWGLIPREQIVGKAWWRIFPPNRWGHVDSRRH